VTLVDTNIVLDIFGHDAVWFDWSLTKLADAGGDEPANVDPLVVAELSRDFGDYVSLRSALSKLGLIIIPLDDESAFVAGKRFHQFRRDRGANEGARVLPDFLIGAHAFVLGVPLLTRDPRLYRRYFPELILITPETHP